MTSLKNIAGLRVHMIGIKGSGMTALAQFLERSGAQLSGSDIADPFYTDAILAGEGISWNAGFDPGHIPSACDLVIYSAAYDEQNNCEYRSALQRGLKMMSYPQALGALSVDRTTVAIAGVHGKTTTTALLGTILQSMQLPGAVIVGSGVRDFNGGQLYFNGSDFLVAETCEYRRHFLHFNPDILVVTSIEEDHLDYFKDFSDIFAAFCEFVTKLPVNGVLICCREDEGSMALALWAEKQRPDLQVLLYGGSDPKLPYSIHQSGICADMQIAHVNLLQPDVLEIPVPGYHSILNSVAAVLAARQLLMRLYPQQIKNHTEEIRRSVATFKGTNRRSEILYNGSILVLDDYAHHPTAIRTTLQGVRTMYAGRRLVVSFMSHTYSRTTALFLDFIDSLKIADVVYFHRVYASARETVLPGQKNGKDLFAGYTQSGGTGYYFDSPISALEHVSALLEPQDVFISLGAGNNWELSHALSARLQGLQE